MNKLSCLLIIMIAFVSCSKDSDTVNIRLSNVSTVNFQNTTVYGVEFGNIEPGQISEYRPFQMAYRRPHIELEIDGENYTILLIDDVGESPLESGNYTCEIDADNDSQSKYGKLILNLVED